MMNRDPEPSIPHVRLELEQWQRDEPSPYDLGDLDDLRWAIRTRVVPHG